MFDPHPDAGVVAVAMTEDAKYLATVSAAEVQVNMLEACCHVCSEHSPNVCIVFPCSC